MVLETRGFDCLKRESPLAFEVRPPTIAAGQKLCMTGLGLRKSPLRARKFLFYVGGRAADLLVRALERFGQRL
jgi:hypothetical protein